MNQIEQKMEIDSSTTNYLKRETNQNNKINQTKLNNSNQKKLSNDRIKPLIDQVFLIRSESRNDLKSIQKKKSKNITLQLESYPAESLLRILAKLFERIVRWNDNLKPSTLPATPSNQLKPHMNQESTLNKTSFKPNTQSLHSLLPLHASPTPPAQSTSVLQFQNLNPHQQQDQLKLDPQTQHSSSSTTPTDHSHRSDSNDNVLVTKDLTSASRKILENPNAILTFHAKVAPAISIEAYLLRILHYCPAPNGVFLSSLIYLDRLSKIHFFGSKNQLDSNQATHQNHPSSSLNQNHADPHQKASSMSTDTNALSAYPHHPGIQFFVDSWNIHRFLIAAFTVASKLFSDVFYTNARYAKVGGLPVNELEKLEIKFLLISDFRMMIGREEFESYGSRVLSEDLYTGSVVPPNQETREESIGKELRKEEDDENENENGVTDVHILESNNMKSGPEWTQTKDEIARRNHESDDADRTTKETTPSNNASTSHPIMTNSTNSRSSSSSIHAAFSSSSSSSSCNSSERSSCSTVTPHSPTPVLAAFNPPIAASTTA